MNNTFTLAALLAASAIASFANTLTLSAVTGNVYQQGVQSPCIFSNPSCGNPVGFTATPLNLVSGGYDALSPVYTAAQISGVIGGAALRVAVDINEASQAQTLKTFEIIVNGSVVDSFTFGGTGNVPATANGNGFGDYLLTGFSAIPAAATVQFHFVFTDANDGTENVFLVAGSSPPAISKSFSPAIIPSGGTTQLTLTVGNPNTSQMTSISFTDSLAAAGLDIPSTTGLVFNGCGAAPDPQSRISRGSRLFLQAGPFLLS